MENIITENLRGLQIKYITLPGTFSWRGVDQGTRLLIENLEIVDGTMIADLGAGAGVLGIVCARLNSSGHIHLLDDHLRSEKLAEKNIELNNLKNAESYLSDLFSAVGDRTYHQIYSNPPAQMGNNFLEEIVRESIKHLKPNGSLWFVIPKNLRPVIQRLFEKYFANCTIVAHGKEHVVMKGVKR